MLSAGSPPVCLSMWDSCCGVHFLTPTTRVYLLRKEVGASVRRILYRHVYRTSREDLGVD